MVNNMRRVLLIVLLGMMFMLMSCQEEEEIIIIEDCGLQFTQTLGEYIPIQSIEIPYSTTDGDLENFINYCKPVSINPIFFSNSIIKTHQFIINFDAIYPIDRMELTSYIGNRAQTIESVSIDYSLNGDSFTRFLTHVELNDELNILTLGGIMAKSLKFTFASTDETFGLQDVKFKLADGIIVKEDKAWSDSFLRFNGWTGADGIFSFNLTDGNDTIGAEKHTTGFVFSDTFVGEVYENNHLRKSSVMINNSLGYFSHDLPFEQAFSFDYPVVDGVAQSAFLPNAYIGSKGRNLLDGDGLSITHHFDGLLTNNNEGTMWLTDESQPDVLIDLGQSENIKKLYFWNYNANPDYGVNDFTLSVSDNGNEYVDIDSYQMPKASGSDEAPYTFFVELTDVHARYIKIHINQGYSDSFVGLGKIMVFDENDRYLFGQSTASSSIATIEPNELSARLWLQDGVVIGDHLYDFPILVKDYSTYFKVHHVGMLQIPIQNERLDYENTAYYNTPLQVHTADGGTIYYGAGLMNHTAKDGYIYIYGYKDLGGRYLVVGRFLPDDIMNFNNWTYFDGTTWSKDINDSYPLIDGVSAELSVTYIESGTFANQYMLVVMENTTSGKISYSLSDSPYGPFAPYVQIYQTNEASYLRSAFTYNAKMHPNLSEPGNFLISYNVNTTAVGALSDANIYYPRFIRIIEVKK